MLKCKILISWLDLFPPEPPFCVSTTLPSLENLIPEHCQQVEIQSSHADSNSGKIRNLQSLYIVYTRLHTIKSRTFCARHWLSNGMFPLRNIRYMIAVAQEIASVIENVYNFCIFHNPLALSNLWNEHFFELADKEPSSYSRVEAMNSWKWGHCGVAGARPTALPVGWWLGTENLCLALTIIWRHAFAAGQRFAHSPWLFLSRV